jgi:nicotinate-nucleotide pyrophosphorylase (carboxylating)
MENLPAYIDFKKIESVIKTALEEDILSGDITSEAILKSTLPAKGRLIAKENFILSGVKVFKTVLRMVNPQIKSDFKYSDGTQINKSEVFAEINGPVISILSAERTALNFLQRMSGIATLTNKYVEVVKNSGAKILDTRKTAPGLRILDKWAVKTGGGENHRIGLYDMVLIKENHISASGGISSAVQKVLGKHGKNFCIEVEIKNITELKEALNLPIDRILLDNMTLVEMRESVKICDKKIPLEASGNVSLENVAEIAGTGVDYISVGSLTHSVKAADISLIII